MRYLLDTNVIGEPRKGPKKADRAVLTWLDRTPPAQVAISVISVLETARGIALIQRRDPTQAAHLQRWWDRTLQTFHGRVLDVDSRVALAAGQLHVPDRRPELDSLIAATAIVHGLTIVTRNVKDFEPMGVAVINPWEAA